MYLADRVKDTTTTTGTGTITVSGTPSSTFVAWNGAGAYAVGDIVPYCIAHQTADEREVGMGVLVTATTISRSAVAVESGSSGAGVLVNFSAGTKDVFSTYRAAAAVSLGPAMMLTQFNYSP